MRTDDSKFAGFPIGIRDTREEAQERKAAKRAEREDPAHLAFVRKQPCMIAGKRSAYDGLRHRCLGRLDPHHEPPVGKRTDWHDRKTVPMCRKAHDERHVLKKARFERRYGVDIEKEAARLDRLNTPAK